MGKYRVNARVTEEWVKQYEIIADSPELAMALVPTLLEIDPLGLRLTGEEKIGEKFGDPSTFTAMEAEPLEEMEESQRLRNLELAKQYRQELGGDLVVSSGYENIGGEIQKRSRKGKRIRN